MNLIIIYPPAILKDPRVVEVMRDLKSPISIEHSLYPCGLCGEPGWIGPKQRLVAEAGGAEVVCLGCVMRRLEILEGMIGMTSLNPAIEQVPRRT